MPDVLIAAIGAAVTGLGVWCLMAILERSGNKDDTNPQEKPESNQSNQTVAHYLPVAINLPLPVGEINISTTKYIRQRSVTEVYFSLDEADWHELEQSDAWKQFQQEFMEVQKGTKS